MAYEPLTYENDKERALKLEAALKNSGIEDTQIQFDTISSSYGIYVSTKEYAKAEEMVQSFYENEEDNESEINALQPDTGKAKILSGASTLDRYQDNLSTGYTFLVVGIAGILFLAAYDFGLIPFLSLAFASKIFFNIVAGALFIGFVLTGIFSLKYSSKIRLQIDVDDTKSTDIMEYLTKNVTAEQIDHMLAEEAQKEQRQETDLPQEILYYKRTQQIQSFILKQYPETGEELLNHLSDAFYEKIF